MVTKACKTPTTEKTVAQQPKETPADALARTSLRPTVQAALTLMDYNKTFGEMSIGTLVNDLGKQCELASRGDLSRAEALLTAQAHTLDAIFHTLARQATRCEYVNQLDVNLRLGLKAQSQCRMTLEALAAIKNPPVVFARQANVTTGPQQINNGTAAPTRAREIETEQTQLLERQNGERLDIGTPGTAVSANRELDAVEEVHRPTHRRG